MYVKKQKQKQKLKQNEITMIRKENELLKKVIARTAIPTERNPKICLLNIHNTKPKEKKEEKEEEKTNK